MKNNYSGNIAIMPALAVNPLAAASGQALSEYGLWALPEGGAGSANFEGAWQYATGKGVLVGLVDEGVNYTHIDLHAAYDQNIDFDPRDPAGASDARPDDMYQQHGTKVAGIIAGSHSNSVGTVGA